MSDVNVLRWNARRKNVLIGNGMKTVLRYTTLHDSRMITMVTVTITSKIPSHNIVSFCAGKPVVSLEREFARGQLYASAHLALTLLA